MIRRFSAAILVLCFALLTSPRPMKAQGATADQYYQYGNRFYQAKDFVNAAKYYQAATQLNPNLVQAHQALGNCLYMQGKKAEALAEYQKTLALNPNNAQLAAYVNNLKAQVGTAPAAAATAPTGSAPTAGSAALSTGSTNAMAQGTALFQQKNYAGAIPYFQQATHDLPNDYRPFYYLAYAQYMTRDFKNAAVNFTLANQKQPNASLKAYADKIKSSLTPEDQQWVDAQVAAGGSAGAGGTKVATQYKKFGIRGLFGIGLYSLKDLNADADFQSAQALKFGYGLTGEVPKGNIWVGLEPFFRPAPAFDIAVGLGVYPVGKYSYTASGPQVLPANGFPTPPFPSSSDAIRSVMTINADQIGLTLRYFVGKNTSKFFFGLGGAYYPSSINISQIAASGDGTINTGVNGDFTGSAMGFHATLGGQFMLGKSVGLEPYLLYRAANIKNYTGTITNNTTGIATTGTLSLVTDNATGNSWVAVDDGKPLPVGETQKALEINLSGIQFGVGVSVFF